MGQNMGGYDPPECLRTIESRRCGRWQGLNLTDRHFFDPQGIFIDLGNPAMIVVPFMKDLTGNDLTVNLRASTRLAVLVVQRFDQCCPGTV